jgi:hypothetical protein
MAADPSSLSEFEDLGPLETAPCGQVEVFDRGLKGETGGLETAAQAVVGSSGGLDIDQQAKAFFKGQLCVLWVLHLLFESETESGQLEFGQFVE